MEQMKRTRSVFVAPLTRIPLMGLGKNVQYLLSNWYKKIIEKNCKKRRIGWDKQVDQMREALAP